MAGLLIAGTSSDAGKSLVVTGLCRSLRRRGIDVAPFKAQNMSNNSMVCADGSEIGRAQYLQAQAAGVEPSGLLNPVLLKPGTDRRSFVVLRGRPAGVLEAGQYATGRGELAAAAFDAYRELEAAHQMVVVEGAGSPAEINLRSGDYVNMGLARRYGLPVVVVGDIDRGGVLASLYGTWALLGGEDRRLLAGYVINKFRGDERVLAPGLDQLTARTGLVNYGVLPWLSEVWLDGEDALTIDRWHASGATRDAGTVLRVAVVKFPRVSNATDVEALARTPGVDVQVTSDADVADAADLLVLPGSRSTVTDLAWLRSRGIDRVVGRRHVAGLPTLGICGGYQMLARSIDDEVEAGTGTVAGLGVLPVTATFGAEKITAQTSHAWRGLTVSGYEIHHGVCLPDADVGAAEPFLDGWRSGATFGTLVHGSFENDRFRDAFLSEIAGLIGSSWRPNPDVLGYSAARELMIETLADAVDEHLNVDALVELASAGTSAPGPQPAQATRRHPLLMVATGDGKGKSTSAFGMGLRAWAQGWPIGVYQFVKGARWPIGERFAYQAMQASGQGGRIEWHTLGVGRTGTRAGRDLDHRAAAIDGWRRVCDDLAQSRHRLYILDEFAHVLAQGWVDVGEVLDVLRARPGIQYVVITGRDAPQQLIDAADLVSRIDKIKHPFDRGWRGQEGIEW